MLARANKIRSLLPGLFAALTITFWTSVAHARNDVNLVIALDSSWSVSGSEFALQLGGISTVFSEPQIIAAIGDGTRGQIGVTITQWSTKHSQKIAVPWTQIKSVEDAIRLANRVARLERLTVEGGTSISGALQHGQALLNTAPFRADRHIIDVVADGENNNGERVETARNALIRLGTTINGLAIVNERSWLHHYLRNRVIGGPGAFVERAADYQDFVHAFRRKLLREIKGDNLTQEIPDGNSRPQRANLRDIPLLLVPVEKM